MLLESLVNLFCIRDIHDSLFRFELFDGGYVLDAVLLNSLFFSLLHPLLNVLRHIRPPNTSFIPMTLVILLHLKNLIDP